MTNVRFLVAVLFVAGMSLMIGGCDTAQDVFNASKPEMPIKSGWRSSMVGRGGVLWIENTSGSAITVDIHIEAWQARQQIKFQATIPAHSTREYGWMEIDWYLENGETVTIWHPDYQTVRWTVKE